VISLVERRTDISCDLIVLDTRVFEELVAIVQLLFHVKAQIHRNWVNARRLGERKSLVREVGEVVVSERGADLRELREPKSLDLTCNWDLNV